MNDKRVVVIGGTGHIGTYLIPLLVEAGHQVVSVSRGQKKPYLPHGAWKNVEQVEMDRKQEEEKGLFGKHIVELEPNIVIDLICFTPKSAKMLVESIRGEVEHLLLCGTIWVHGPSAEVPTTEDQPRNPLEKYGKDKAKIEDYLLTESRKNGFPSTVLHPGHIVGQGWVPVNPAGNKSIEVFSKLAKGQELNLPNIGLETLHHVHAKDVAQGFYKAMINWNSAVGESFHIVSPAALTLRGFAHSIASWFGQSAQLNFLSWEEWSKTVSDKEKDSTWNHISHSPNCSINKAQKAINYNPRYYSLQAVKESLRWLIDKGKLDAELPYTN